jgi:uncharacterized RDD family membrane protein YckC
MEPLPAETATDLSAELESLAGQYSYASKGQRFVNLLIDSIAIFLVMLTIQVIRYLIGGIPTGSDDSSHDQNMTTLIFYLVWFGSSFLYYVVMEGLCRGRTVGKFCTRTKVVHFDTEQPIGIGKAMARSLCRYVPFEALSGFATPWHDSWTQTTVVKINV